MWAETHVQRLFCFYLAELPKEGKDTNPPATASIDTDGLNKFQLLI